MMSGTAFAVEQHNAFLARNFLAKADVVDPEPSHNKK